MKKFSIIFTLFYLFLSNVSLADSSANSTDSHVKKGNAYLSDGRYFMAIDEYREAIKNGLQDSFVFEKLAFIYYDLGFLDEAISMMEKAVDLSPDSYFLQIELGTFYFAKGQMNKAKERFLTVLNKNPGFSDAYYYLGEIFYRTKDYKRAWLFARTAQRLGHQGNDLVKKLSALSEAPNINPWDYSGKDLYFRQILVDTKGEAEEIVRRIAEGELFEVLAGKSSKGTNSGIGGYMGRFEPSALHPKIAEALLGSEVLSKPTIVETPAGFHIIQRILPFDFNYWEKLLADSSASKAMETHNKQVRIEEKKESFLVFVGSFKEENYAIERLNKIRKLGYPGYRFVQQTKLNGPMHMVVAGKYDSFEMAKEAGENIAKHGFEYFISK